MPDPPNGTVTFLLSDVEGSTAHWERDPEAMRLALARHDALFEETVQRHGGQHIRPRGEGDSRFAVFWTAPATCRPVSRRCTTPSPGATTSSPPRSNGSFGGWACSWAGSPSMPPNG